MNPKDVVLPIALGGAGEGGGGDDDITKATLAPTFSSSTTYAAGDYVWHSGKMYRFTMAHEAGSWTGTDVEEAPLSAGITDLKSAVDAVESKITAVDSSFPQGPAQGSIVTIDDGADNVPVVSLTAQIVPIQSGTGDPAPDNVRPISGWTGANINVTGKNLLPKLTAGTYTANGVTTVVDSDGVVHMSGTTTSAGNVWIIPFEEPFTFDPKLVEAGLYYHMFNTAARSFQPAFEDGSTMSTGWALTPINRIATIDDFLLAKR